MAHNFKSVWGHSTHLQARHRACRLLNCHDCMCVYIQRLIYGSKWIWHAVDLALVATMLGLLQAFLSLCQGNHYQFDTIRRAKHSSAMVLYHLHNPDAPAFASVCNCCGLEIEAGHGFRCPQCTDFDLCANCHNTGRAQHIHPLVVGNPKPCCSLQVHCDLLARSSESHVVIIPTCVPDSLHYRRQTTFVCIRLLALYFYKLGFAQILCDLMRVCCAGASATHQ